MEEQIVLVDHEIALHNPDCLGHSKTNIEIFLFQLKKKIVYTSSASIVMHLSISAFS